MSLGVRRSLMAVLPNKKWALLLPPLAVIASLFGSQMLAISRFRLDYPINDDWRYYLSPYRMPEALNLEWVFLPAKDTIHVTGKLMDWLVFQHVSHDYSLLATLSFGLFFGGWLLAALALLKVAAKDRLITQFCSLLVLCLALAGSPYWVTVSPFQWLEPAIAYHQMLPVLGLTLLGLLCAVDRGRWPRGLAPALAAVLTVFFSLVYSSGAVAMAGFGAALLAVAELTRRTRGETPNSAIGLAAIICLTAAACLTLHVLLPIHYYEVNPIIKARTYSLALPTELSFWRFFVGLFDRAVLSTVVGWTPDLRGGLVAFFFSIPIFWLPVLIVRDRISPEFRSRAIVLVAALAAVLIYALLVSYGRANFGAKYMPHSVDHLRPSLYARNRFFFWWITAFLPLAVVAWSMALEQTFSRRSAALIVPILALLLLLPKAQHVESEINYFQHWSYSSLYEQDADELELLIESDRRSLRTGIRDDRGVLWTRRLGIPARRICRLAAKSGANFVDRWELIPKGRSPGPRR